MAIVEKIPIQQWILVTIWFPTKIGFHDVASFLHKKIKMMYMHQIHLVNILTQNRECGAHEHFTMRNLLGKYVYVDNFEEFFINVTIVEKEWGKKENHWECWKFNMTLTQVST